jgi:hypothetical protein
MVFFNWLHLTDMHLGMEGLSDLWQNVEEDFFKDVKYLIDKIGPLDLVLFTGDLVQQGSSDEFEQVNLLFEKFWHKFREMGCEPKLLAVPGNHDLTRPKNLQDPALVTLTKLWDDPAVVRPFWDDPESAQRKLVDEAFANYMHWWQNIPVPKLNIDSLGILTGDFSATLEKEGVKLGIVGLNSTFLQLIGGDLKGKLALNVRQFNKACGGHGPDWVNQHDLCLLLTHQPPDWLTREAQDQLEGEIHHPPERFALHLFGHMHEPELRVIAFGGSKDRRQMQGCSLFGMEGWGENKDKERIHGYSLGQLKVEGSTAYLRIWPRKVTKQKNVWSFNLDIQDFHFTRGEDGIDPMPVTLLRSRPNQPQSNPGTGGKGSDLINTGGGANISGNLNNKGGVNLFGGSAENVYYSQITNVYYPGTSMDAAQTKGDVPVEQSSTVSDHRREQVLLKPSPDAGFLEWAQYYIMDAKKVTKDAQISLITSGYISPIEYINKFNALDDIKRGFEKFYKLIDETPKPSGDIPSTREHLRVDVKRVIKQIEEVQSCINDRKSSCNDLGGKFISLLITLEGLGRVCKLND